MTITIASKTSSKNMITGFIFCWFHRKRPKYTSHICTNYFSVTVYMITCLRFLSILIIFLMWSASSEDCILRMTHVEKCSQSLFTDGMNSTGLLLQVTFFNSVLKSPLHSVASTAPGPHCWSCLCCWWAWVCRRRPPASSSERLCWASPDACTSCYLSTTF